MSGGDLNTGGFIARVGSVAADGQGHITSGLEDVLDLGSGSAASLVTFSNGTYQIQANGRGLIVLNVTGGGSLQRSASLLSNSQGYLVQTDGLASTSGSLALQTPLQFSANAINGKYVFDFSGLSFAGTTPSQISLVGQFGADGNGNVTGGTIDVNDGAFAPTGAVALTASSYQMDTNGNGTNFGRGTMTLDGRTFTFYNSSIGTVTYVFYLYSPTRAVIQDVSAGIVADGTMASQSAASFTTASVSGNYSFSWSGVELVQPAPFDENYVGQYVQTSPATSNIAGVVDYAQLGLNAINTNGVTLNAGISGTLTIAGDGTQDNSYKIVIGGPSAFTVNFVAYFADNGTVMMVCSDGNRPTLGLSPPQTQ